MFLSFKQVGGNLHRDQRGVVAVIMVLTLTVLLGMTAAVVDIGLLAHADRETQNAADAAALAGASALPNLPGAASGLATAYAVTNGEPGDEVDVEVQSANAANDSIRVTISREVPFLFAGILGIGDGEVTGEAVAQVGSAGGAGGLLPFGVECEFPPCFVDGEVIELKLITGGVGNWNPIRLDGQGAEVYLQTIINGSASTPTIGQSVQPEPGNMDDPTIDGIGIRIGGNTQSWQDVFGPMGGDGHRQIIDGTSSRLVVIPYVTPYPPGASSTVQITGFGVFFLEGITGDAGVQGRFMNAYVPSSIFTPFDSSLGAQLVRLVS